VHPVKANEPGRAPPQQDIITGLRLDHIAELARLERKNCCLNVRIGQVTARQPAQLAFVTGS